MPVAGGPKITTTGILLDVDAADKTSYPGSGTTWINPFTPGTYDGTLNNISFDSNDSKGALIFTGSNTYVDFGNLGPSLTSSFSFQVAFKPAATASDQPYTILSYASASATSSITFKLDYTSSNQTVVLSTFSNTGSQNIVYAISASVASGSWNIVHGTFGTLLAALYVNGLGQAYVGTTGSAVGYNTSNRLYAGGTYGLDSGFYTGSMANVTVNNADLGGLDVNKNYNALSYRFGLPVRRPTVTDADAFNFVEAAGIVDATQQTAINNLVLGLKANNLWNKMQALYPFIGGSAYSHKFNLKDTTLNQLRFLGGITHDSNGYQPDGGPASYATTTITNNTYTSGDYHLSFYTNQSITGSQLFSADVTTTGTGNITAHRNNDNNRFFFGGLALQTAKVPPYSGFHVGSRISTTSTKYYKDGISLITNTTLDTATPGTTLVLSNVAGEIRNYFASPRAQQFTSIGLGLTDADVSNLYTLVQAYQTTLGRQA